MERVDGWKLYKRGQKYQIGYQGYFFMKWSAGFGSDGEHYYVNCGCRIWETTDKDYACMMVDKINKWQKLEDEFKRDQWKVEECSEMVKRAKPPMKE